jgi:hypothetical protein
MRGSSAIKCIRIGERLGEEVWERRLEIKGDVQEWYAPSHGRGEMFEKFPA